MFGRGAKPAGPKRPTVAPVGGRAPKTGTPAPAPKPRVKNTRDYGKKAPAPMGPMFPTGSY